MLKNDLQNRPRHIRSQAFCADQVLVNKENRNCATHDLESKWPVGGVSHRRPEDLEHFRAACFQRLDSPPGTGVRGHRAKQEHEERN